MAPIMALAEARGLAVVEDCAQASYGRRCHFKSADIYPNVLNKSY
jgi:dTDP-4-amino-4,6-dideoxygalactose transaminase